MLTPKIEARIEQKLKFLETQCYSDVVPLAFEVYETEESLRTPPPDNAAWKKIAAPYEYGKPWTLFWFRTVFCIAETEVGANRKGTLFLRVMPNSDSLVFVDGKPFGAFNPFHQKINISDLTAGTHTLHIESYGGHPYPGCAPFEGDRIIFTLSHQIPSYPNIFSGGSVTVRNDAVYSLYYDARSLYETAKALDNNSLRKARILKTLYDELMKLPYNESDFQNFEISKLSPIKALLETHNGDTTPEVSLIGHAHIDHAWLWHIGETERKIARTYSNMVRLSEEYPEFVFIQSQPCQLEIIKREYPDIFTEVQRTYKKGKWEPNGGMWVEADCNVTGGESLIRQFLVGKAANKEMLGVDAEADTLWLPDVFGYAAALPQILKGCRIKYFVTSKISWNDTTHFPYDTFIWYGLDGTGIKTHYILGRKEGYNGRVSADTITGVWNEVQHKELQSICIKSIGEGDGGGGTTREDLEMAKRLAGMEGLPKTSWQKVSATLDKIFENADELPKWNGELYLELHRGTYTTQARTKKNNRRLEYLLRGTEMFAAINSLKNGTEYPYDTLLGSWKRVLTNQFHDIIPGSSIHRVYEETEADAAGNIATLKKIRSEMFEKCRPHDAPHNSKPAITIFNELSWQRKDPITVKADLFGEDYNGIQTAKSGVLPIQKYTSIDGAEMAVFSGEIPPIGYQTFTLVDSPPTEPHPFACKDNSLQTPFYTVRFDDAGRMVSLFDTQREVELVEADGHFNAFVTAEDVPVLWDAWDIDNDWKLGAKSETTLQSTEIISAGAECIRIRRIYKIATASSLTQDMVFYAQNPRIDFDTKVDWKERRQLLKVSFDTAIHTDKLRCEVQYGNIIRNTHTNLAEDRAKFEVCAHKWVCVEETGAEGGGIALLNDCKYGHNAEGGKVSLTLLRSPIAPDFDADAGVHYFVYSLLPFGGNYADAGVVCAAYELNVPATAVSGVAEAQIESSEYSFCQIDGNSVIIEALKAPEDKETGTVVLRLYESSGGRAKTVLHFGHITDKGKIAKVLATDMLEENGTPLEFIGNDILLTFQAFEIKTLRVTFG